MAEAGAVAEAGTKPRKTIQLREQHPAMNQSAVVIGGIMVAFVLYLAVNDRLKVYLAMIGL